MTAFFIGLLLFFAYGVLRLLAPEILSTWFDSHQLIRALLPRTWKVLLSLAAFSASNRS